MNEDVTGAIIKKLREQKGLTQKQLADQLFVSDKAVSKWETMKGLPTVGLLEPLAKALGVSLPELVSGNCVCNHNKNFNMLKSCFYVCPVCGNVVVSSGKGAFNCCGLALSLLQIQMPDAEHKAQVELIDNEFYVHIDAHPMTKQHYISFFLICLGKGCN